MKNEDIYKYFIDLDKQKLERENGAILQTPSNITPIHDIDERLYLVSSNLFYHKYLGELDDTLQTISASQLYSHSGIACPPVFLSKEKGENVYSQLTQDVCLPHFKVCLQPLNIKQYEKLIGLDFWQSNKWQILYHKHLKEHFLTFMTKDCFDQLISLFLLDELRTESDRHILNYFLYKTTKNGKYEGIIAIDMDLVEILSQDILNEETFKDFVIHHKFESLAPTTNIVVNTHQKAINKIKNLIYQNKLSENNIVTIKSALEFDFAKKIIENGEKYDGDPKQIDRVYTPISYLWDYNRKELGKELGL